LVILSKKEKPVPDKSLAQQILPTSGTMIGICTTFIGLVKIVEARIGASRVDEYAACASMFFLASAVTSYLSIRYSHRSKISKSLETVADQSFLIGLLAISSIALLFAYEAI
jgi:hypothetical protein